jgi:4-hydroxy 2-oxovalerate aldolase
VKHIKILDCTLRDGGYLNDFNFGNEVINGIIAGLVKSNIDIIECGFLKDKEYMTGSTVFSCVSDILPHMPSDKHENISFVGMIDHGRYDITKLTPFDGKTIDSIRDCFFKNDRFSAMESAEEITKKGYRLYIQPVDILGYSDLEIIDLIEKVNNLNVYAFSIVDTFGSMYSDDLVRIFSLVDHNLKKNVVLGFHSHNNMQLSFALSQKFAEISQGKRDIIIDCTILGMGRGAGNTPTELMVNYLNSKWLGYDYNLNQLLDVIDDYMLPIQKKQIWGYNIPNYIAGMYNSHVHNVTYLMDKHNITSKNMRIIIEMIDPIVRKRYDYDNLESIYINYIDHKIDDSADIKQLHNIFKENVILILAPGKTLETHKMIIEEFIKKNNVIAISANFIPTNFDVQFSFFSNQKRLERNIEFKNQNMQKSALIITSNVQTEYRSNTTFVINYASLTKRKRWKYFDNSLVLLVRFLCTMDVKRIYIAGADGFSDNNYSDNNSFLETNISKSESSIFNVEMKEMFQDILCDMSIQNFLTFITPSLYVEK